MDLWDFQVQLGFQKPKACQHFVILFTAMTVTPFILLKQKTSVVWSFYLYLNYIRKQLKKAETPTRHDQRNNVQCYP